MKQPDNGKSKMPRRNIGQEVLEGIRDIKAYKASRKALHVRKLNPSYFRK